MRASNAAAHKHRADLAATSFTGSQNIVLLQAAFVHILQRLPKGKAGGQDGIVAEFLQPRSAKRAAPLHRTVEARLQGCEAAPPSWSEATVMLIPKKASGHLAGGLPADHRPAHHPKADPSKLDGVGGPVPLAQESAVPWVQARLPECGSTPDHQTDH